MYGVDDAELVVGVVVETRPNGDGSGIVAVVLAVVLPAAVEVEVTGRSCLTLGEVVCWRTDGCWMF
jgi:hypothetical protein